MWTENEAFKKRFSQYRQQNDWTKESVLQAVDAFIGFDYWEGLETEKTPERAIHIHFPEGATIRRGMEGESILPRDKPEGKTSIPRRPLRTTFLEKEWEE